MTKAKVVSKLKYTRISPKKVAPVLNLVRGKAALEAARILKFDTTKGAKLALKALNTAIADAKDAHKMNEKDLVVSEIRVDEGPMFKRGRATARGRYSPRFKRTSHIVVGLVSTVEEKVGKDSKKPERKK